MGPAALLDYGPQAACAGWVLEEGTANSHVSIVARALGIPAVGEVPETRPACDPGDAIIRRRHLGRDLCAALRRDRTAYAERVRFRARRQAQYSALRDKPASPRTASASS